MRTLRRFLARLGACTTGRRHEDRLKQEIEQHLALQTEENFRAGLPPAEARRQAVLKFGAVEAIKEEYRDERGLPFLETLLRDTRHAIRQLHKSPGFALTAVLILALGIGATTAIYSVANAVIFTPLPFPKPDRLVYIGQGYKNGRYEPGGENIGLMSVRNGLFQDWREQARCFASMAATQTRQVILMAGNRTLVVDGFLVGDEFFETLGVPARIGRYFAASDYAIEGSRVVVLGDRFWRAQYNADPSIVGREIVLDGAAHRVVGVMPPGFLPTRNERDPQLWLPMVWTPATKYSRELWGNRVYARLKAGVTLQQAQSEMDRVDTQLRMAYPNEAGNSVVAPLDGYLFGYHERMFLLQLPAVGVVLLIACANVANLLLARTLGRQREFAVRSALGASRVAILRQVLAESLVIAGVGGLAGVALTPLLTRPAVALLPAASKIPRLDQVHLDLGVLLFTFSVSMGSGLLFGVVPAIRSGRSDLSLALNSRGRGSSLGKNEGRLSDSLVVAEVALSLVLLVGGGLLTRAFLKLLHNNPGFHPAQSIALQLSIPVYRYGNYDGKRSTDAGRRQLYDGLERAVQSLATVEAVGVSAKLPLRQFWDGEPISIEGRPPLPSRGSIRPRINNRLGLPVHGDVSIQMVSPGYFGALGIPLVHGRLFDSRDRPDAPMTALINETTVRNLFPNENPISKRIAINSTQTTIVGIVGDCRLDGMDREILPEVFWPMAQLPSPNAWLIARARGDNGSISNALRSAVHDVDPEIGIVELSTMTSVVGDSLWRERFSALLIGLFAALAVLIASGGMYAVVSHAVARRTHEMGVRLALGATGAHIARTVLSHRLRVTAIGIALGTLLTMTAGRLLAQQAYELSDLPWMFAAVASLLIILTLLACWGPLRKALAVDPMTTLRAE